MKLIVFVSFIGLCEYNESYKLIIIWMTRDRGITYSIDQVENSGFRFDGHFIHI